MATSNSKCSGRGESPENAGESPKFSPPVGPSRQGAWTSWMPIDRATVRRTEVRAPRAIASKATALAVFALFFALLCFVPPAGAEPPLPKDFQTHAARVKKNFEEARSRWSKETNSADAAWRFGRAAFDWAEFAKTGDQRAAIAEEGIAACRRGLSLDSNHVAVHYYLALNLGQLARTKMLGALKLIHEMEHEWKAAIRLDPKFDFAGPHRSIGVLYRDAPGWPTSIGSEKKSRHHLEKAVELHPEYPGNRLALFEGYLEWGDKNLIRADAAKMESTLKTARNILVGETWALDWEDWQRRWNRVKAEAGVKD